MSHVVAFFSVGIHTLLGFEPCCSFEPTCSNYAADAFKKKSWPTAFFLTIHRLFRCRPGGGSGMDPVL